METLRKPFYQKSFFMWVSLFLFAPIGIFLLWKYSKIKKPLKIILSIVFGFIFVILMIASTVDTPTTAPNQSSSIAPPAEPAPSESTPAVSEEQPVPSFTIFQEGHYKIGADMPAGEYRLLPTSPISSYFEIAVDSSGKLESILANDNFGSNRYVTVQEGEYLKLSGCKAIPAEEVYPLATQNGQYRSGMYKVGFDIPAGEHKVVASDDLAYFEVSSNSRGTLESIITNELFDDSRYISVSDGQYLKLNDCYISAN